MSPMKNLSPSITDMIRFDHSHVSVTFHQYVATKKVSVKKALAETICDAFEIHATLEEEIFYPALRQRGVGGTVLAESVPEHDTMRKLVLQIRTGDPSSARYDRLVFDLMHEVLHHVADEETVLLPEAERLFQKSALNEMGARMTARRLELLAPKAGKVARNTAVGFSQSTAARVTGVVALMLGALVVARKAA